MRKLTLKIEKFVSENLIMSLFIFSFIIQLISFGLSILKEVLNIDSNIENETFYTSNYELVLSSLVIAPLFETLFNQVLFFNLLKKLNRIFFIIISAFFFSILHYFKNNDLYEMFILFINGLIFSYSYSLYSKLGSQAFWNVVFIHIFCNIPFVIYIFWNRGFINFYLL